MAQAISISLKKFNASVQSAVKAAMAKHPKFQVETPKGVTVSYLIRGFPVPDGILSKVTLQETQAFANEVATQIAAEHPEAFGAGRGGAEGAVLSVGRHIIIGIPPIEQTFRLEE